MALLRLQVWISENHIPHVAHVEVHIHFFERRGPETAGIIGAEGHPWKLIYDGESLCECLLSRSREIIVTDAAHNVQLVGDVPVKLCIAVDIVLFVFGIVNENTTYSWAYITTEKMGGYEHPGPGDVIFFKVSGGNGVKDFGTDRADALAKSVKDDAFFKAGHKIVISSQNEIASYSELERLKRSELERVLSDPEVKRTFDAIDKKLSANQQLKAFKDAISEQRDLLLELRDYDEFKRKVWYSFIAGAMSEYIDAIQTFRSRKNEIEQIFRAAESEEPKWANIINIFNTRFHAPFVVKITNQRDLVLKKNAPSLKFFYKKIDGTIVEEDRGVLMQILSKGEQRAFTILQIIFQVEERKSTQDHVLVFDDISDSFDYKNKYAIIEYLADYIASGNFKVITLTHNFDFYRTIVERLGLRSSQTSLMALKNGNVISLKAADDIKDVFGRWFNHISRRNLIAMIPFVRNIVQYLKGADSEEYKFLTCCLHCKNQIPTGHSFMPTGNMQGRDIVLGYCSIFACRSHFASELNSFLSSRDGSGRYLDWLISEMNDIKDESQRPNFNEISLCNKVVLAIGIRLLAEKFILNKLQAQHFQYVEADENQTRDLINTYKRECADDPNFTTDSQILARVCLMTPEQIHLNSFMFEPLVDMSVQELLSLYDAVSSWRVAL